MDLLRRILGLEEETDPHKLAHDMTHENMQELVTALSRRIAMAVVRGSAETQQDMRVQAERIAQAAALRAAYDLLLLMMEPDQDTMSEIEGLSEHIKETVAVVRIGPNGPKMPTTKGPVH